MNVDKLKTIGFYIFIVTILYVVMFQEIIYYSTKPDLTYTIEVVHKYGSKETLYVKKPAGFYFVILQAYSYNKYDYYYLAGIPKAGDLILGGHYQTICKDATSFKILGIENEQR